MLARLVFIIVDFIRAGWLVSLHVSRLHCLQATPQAKHQEQRGLLLNVVVTQSTPVVELLAGEDEALLVGRHALLVVNLLLDVVDGVARVHVEGDGAAHESLDEDLHVVFVVVLRWWGLFVVGE